MEPKIQHFRIFLTDYFIYPVYLCESLAKFKHIVITTNAFHDTFQTSYIVICGITLQISVCKHCVDLIPCIFSRGKDHTHSDLTK